MPELFDTQTWCRAAERKLALDTSVCEGKDTARSPGAEGVSNEAESLSELRGEETE